MVGLISPFHLFNFPFLGNLKSVKSNIAFRLLGASFRFGVTEESGLSMLCRIYGKIHITVVKFGITDTYALAQKSEWICGTFKPLQTKYLLSNPS